MDRRSFGLDGFKFKTFAHADGGGSHDDRARTRGGQNTKGEFSLGPQKWTATAPRVSFVSVGA